MIWLFGYVMIYFDNIYKNLILKLQQSFLSVRATMAIDAENHQSLHQNTFTWYFFRTKKSFKGLEAPYMVFWYKAYFHKIEAYKKLSKDIWKKFCAQFVLRYDKKQTFLP